MKRLRIKFYVLLLGSLAAIGLGIWAFVIEPDQLIVKNYELKVQNWSPKLDGFRIVAISDIHGGANFIGQEKIRRVVAEANAQDADIIVLLGDYVSTGFFNRQAIQMPIETVAENLQGLRAKHGVYAVLGNKDGNYGDVVVRAELEKNGIKVLENEIAGIEKNGEKLFVFGLKDHLKINTWADFSTELKQVLSKNEENGNIIVLEHSPDVLPIITGDLLISENLRLILSGHTHGGQCRFPLVGAPFVPSSYGQKYASGHIRENDVDMFVTTGIGTSILPVRFSIPPEISVLHIRAE